MKNITNKKLPAFTLMELTLALGMSTFIILIGMYIFRIFTVQFYNYQKVNEELFEISSLQFLLENDAANAHWMKVQNSKLVFEKENIKIEYIYRYSDLILRENNLETTDTFHLEHQSPLFNFNNEKRMQGFIDNFQIKCKFGEKWCFIATEKQYSALELLIINKKD